MKTTSAHSSRDTLDSTDDQRRVWQTEFERRVPQSVRNQKGQFATPPQLAEAMLRVAEDVFGRSTSIRFLDPALGSGVFFYALMKVYGPTATASARGFETDPVLAEIADDLWGSFGLNISRIDFTSAPPPTEDEKANLIVCNPPYVRHHHLDRDTKLRLNDSVRRLGFSMSGLAGLYSYFMLLAHDWLAEGGGAVWIVPAEFLDVNYGTTLKKYLATKVTTNLIYRFAPEEVQFEDALVTSVVLAFTNKAPSRNHEITFSCGSDLLDNRTSNKVSIKELDPNEKWSLRFGPLTPRSIEQRRHTLSDFFYIKRGLATGANAFFVLERANAQELGLPCQFLRPILPPPRLIAEAIIESDEDGFPKHLPQLVLIDCSLPPHELLETYPELFEYLRQGEKGIADRYLTACRSPWYKQEQRPPAPILCTYMSRRKTDGRVFRFFRNRSQATALNVYLMLYPKPILERAIQTHPTLLDEIFDYLHSAENVETVGRVYGGGLNKVEPAELGRLGMPNDLSATIRTLSGSFLFEMEEELNYATVQRRS